jgi:phosphohistidine swiveling domain-containing protein
LDSRKKWEKELKLNKKELALFVAMRDAAHLKELRKKFVSQSLYYFDPVLSEIGKRLYMSIKQVRFLRTKDVYEALVKGKDLSQEMNNRFKLSVWQCSGKNTKVTTGAKAQEMFAQFCQVDKNATEFSGMPVSPGVARGPAKIVLNPNECTKVEKGDIIVSVQVVPSFSTAIIKSAGIVCDGGHGITSHPATLSREAGIPCVIQTRFVREVVKDGDILEVDGYKGIVKIIK